MTVGLKGYWEAAAPFDEWLDRVESNRDLWRGIYERTRIDPDTVARVDGPYRLLVLAEDWCGDAVNTVPWLARLAEESEHLELRVLRRDEHPALMATHRRGPLDPGGHGPRRRVRGARVVGTPTGGAPGVGPR